MLSFHRGDDMGQEWVTVTNACQRLAISQRTLYRRIDKGIIKSKVDNGKRFILIELSNDKAIADSFDNVANRELIDALKIENENLRKQVDQQQAIIMQLSRNQQIMLESTEQKKQREKKPFWSKLWKKKNE
jgi:predicted site-specific integrase-resolvase